MLDVNKTLIIIISVLIYAVAIIPLIIFYFKSRGEKTFNQDAVSNAQIKYEKEPEKKATADRISKKILRSYTFVYFIYCFQDCFSHAFNLHLFLTTGSYGVAGYLNAIYNGCYGVGCYVFDLIAKKKDTTVLVSISCVGCALCMAGAIVIKNIPLLCALCAVAGVLYAFLCTFNLERLLPKCRIMGVANNALFNRENASNCAVMAPFMFGLFGSMSPVLIVTSIAMALSSAVIPVNEEYTRRQLIAYLQNHERVMTPIKKPRKSKKIKEM